MSQPSPKAAAAASKKLPAAEPTLCGFPIGAGACGAAATCQLPVGSCSNAEPLPLCPLHAPRFLGAAEALPTP